MKRTWTTKDGRKIKIKELSNTHLINIYKMLARKHDKAIDAACHFLAYLTGEMAIDCMENTLYNLEEIDDWEFVETLCPEITREIELRKLVEEIR